jgi:hypothetical protein
MKHLLLLLLLVGCSVDPEAVPEDAPEAAVVPVAEHPLTDGELVAPPDLAPDTRVRRRMDVDQLAASIETVTGFAWTDADGNDRFEELAETLGKPDYVDSTQEDLSPSLVFQKFLGDAAHATCDRLMAAESERAPASRIYYVHADEDSTVEADPAAVEANLRHLMLRFHGRSVPEGAPELQRWTWLLESATFVAGEPRKGWHAVCVGLITHPRFYTY